MKRILVVVDMQNDFVDGALGTAEAVAILPNVVKVIQAFDGDEIFVTFDTHFEDYMSTLEGKKLPVPHCIEGTKGHELAPAVSAALNEKTYHKVIKPGFGTFEIVDYLKETYYGEEVTFEFVGLCTDICVATNVLIARAAFPNAEITVYENCCAGVTPEAHNAAIATMKSCQIDIAEA